jgi:hypothetical protein
MLEELIIFNLDGNERFLDSLDSIEELRYIINIIMNEFPYSLGYAIGQEVCRLQFNASILNMIVESGLVTDERLLRVVALAPIMNTKYTNQHVFFTLFNNYLLRNNINELYTDEDLYFRFVPRIMNPEFYQREFDNIENERKYISVTFLNNFINFFSDMHDNQVTKSSLAIASDNNNAVMYDDTTVTKNNDNAVMVTNDNDNDDDDNDSDDNNNKFNLYSPQSSQESQASDYSVYGSKIPPNSPNSSDESDDDNDYINLPFFPISSKRRIYDSSIRTPRTAFFNDEVEDFPYNDTTIINDVDLSKLKARKRLDENDYLSNKKRGSVVDPQQNIYLNSNNSRGWGGNNTRKNKRKQPKKYKSYNRKNNRTKTNRKSKSKKHNKSKTNKKPKKSQRKHR